MYMLNDNDAKQYTMSKSDILKIYYADREQKPEAVATASDVVAPNQATETVAPVASEHPAPVASNNKKIHDRLRVSHGYRIRRVG